LKLFLDIYSKAKYYHLDVHTIFHVSNDELIHESTTDERLARMVMFAFGSALVQARQLYPNGILTKPITVQSIFLLDELFHFVIFQLNTLNYNDPNDQRSNYVWIDKDNYLYDNRPSMVMYNPRYGTERNLQRYVLEKLKYNPIVFEKFLALYLQGVK
jgi:large subunit ribosomal protein L37